MRLILRKIMGIQLSYRNGADPIKKERGCKAEGERAEAEKWKL